jgi:hypothetical protein
MSIVKRLRTDVGKVINLYRWAYRQAKAAARDETAQSWFEDACAIALCLTLAAAMAIGLAIR